MKIETREVDLQRGIIQITTADERWYSMKDSAGQATVFVPSVSWICGHYPKGVAFYKWLARTGWSEAEERKATAGEQGSKVHQGVRRLVQGETLHIETCLFTDPETGTQATATPHEWECLMSFADWCRRTKPEFLGCEYVVWSTGKMKYAGMVDLKCRIDGRVWLIDCKTSAAVWPSMELQVTGYKYADPDPEVKTAKLGILQLGFKYNKKQKWRLTEVKYQLPLFRAVYRIWKKEMAGVKPFQRDFPLEIHL
jgi:hypothetical protein